MKLGRFRARVTREWVILLLLPALAFRLLVPEGFMPAFGDGAELTMQMCHGDGKSSLVIRLTGRGGDAPSEPAKHDAPCVFAASGPVAPPAVAILSPHLAVQLEPFASVRPASVNRPTPHRPQSPRAPPLAV